MSEKQEVTGNLLISQFSKKLWTAALLRMSWSGNMIQADNMGRPQMTLKDSEILSKTPSDTFWYTLKGITKLWNKFAAHLILIWLITILFYAARGIFQPVVVENSFLHILIKFSKLLRNKNERLKAGQLAGCIDEVYLLLPSNYAF